MARQVPWLSDAEWGRTEPLLPRGGKGAHRVDDRRVISGIVHMLRIAAPWRTRPRNTGRKQRCTTTFNWWSRQGDLAWHVRGLDRPQRHLGIGHGCDCCHSCQGAPLAAGTKGGLGAGDRKSRGGRTTKLHG